MALVLLFYSMAGAYKVWDATQMLLSGQTGGFSPYAMANTIAWRQISTNTDPIYADMLMDAPLLGWPLYLGLYYAQFFAIVILFRPALHRLWGVILIGFHFGTIVLMDISFPYHIAINAILLLLSPYAPDRFDLRQIAASLPLFGVLFRAGLGWKTHSDEMEAARTSSP